MRYFFIIFAQNVLMDRWRYFIFSESWNGKEIHSRCYWLQFCISHIVLFIYLFICRYEQCQRDVEREELSSLINWDILISG